MQLKNLCDRLDAYKIEYKKNEPMNRHTTFKIGGMCDLFITVKNEDELKNVLVSLKEFNVPCFTVGKGSNLLVSDKGIDGAVISLEKIDNIKIDGNELVCGAGASLRSVCIAAQKAGLSGLEFAYGIPGTLGGAVYMNAGAYGGEISQVAVSVSAMNSDGKTVDFSLPDMKLGYRTSAFKSNGFIITNVRLKLNRGNSDEIKSKMDDFFARRREKQPLEYPSAGSTFKRPEGHFAGALIEKNNLKGASFGGAEVSEKHAGFIINKNGATCLDVLSLIKKVQDTVKSADGVLLEPEVIFVGRN